MSIIHDALKKAQQKLKEQEGENLSNKEDKAKDIPPSSSSPHVPDSSPAAPAPWQAASQAMSPEAQNSVAKDKNPAEPPTAPPPSSPAPASTTDTASGKSPSKRLLAPFLVILFLCGGILLATQLSSPETSPLMKFLSRLTNNTSLSSQAQNSGTKGHVPAPKDMILTGISLIEDKKIALLNGEIYEEGQAFKNWTITTINPDEVLLSNDRGEIIRLKLSELPE